MDAVSSEAPHLCGKGGGRGRRGEGCLSDVDHVVSLTFVSWLTVSLPAATWSTLATAMRIMYWRGGYIHTTGFRHTGVHTHQGSDTPGYIHTRVQTHRGTGTPGYRHTGVQTHQGTDMPGYKHTRVQTCMHMHTQPLLLLMSWTRIWNGMQRTRMLF